MPLLKTEGIVMKQINLGEADKIITLFTDKLGKIQVVAHGARKTKSKLLSSSQVFCYGEYLLYKGKSLYTINQCDIKESFQGLLGDLYTLTYVSYMIELLDVLVQNEEPNQELFVLLLKCMYLIGDENTDRELLTRIFELKSMAFSGYMPNLNKCEYCGGNDIKNYVFSAKSGGLICLNCHGNDTGGISVDALTINLLKYFLKYDIENVRTVKVSNHNKTELKRLLKSYIKYYLDRDFKSLDFLENIKSVDNL